MITALLLALIALITSAFGYQAIGAAQDRKRYPARGRIIPIDGRRLHIFEEGSGTPAVVFEAGLAASSLSWAHVQPRVAAFTRTLSYDRAGLGWSDACSPRTVPQMADELRDLLRRAGIDAPFVLVGHSFGSLILRGFAHRFADQVAGIVLVDPVSIETWANCSELDARRIAIGARFSRRGAWLARLGVVRLAIALAGLRGGTLTRAIARASAGRATSTLGRLVGEIQKLPPELVPAVRAHWSSPKPFRAMAHYLECLPEAARDASELTIPAQLPLIVLSAATATAAEIAERERWIEGRPNAEHWLVPETGHWLHLERPDVVADAVRKALETS